MSHGNNPSWRYAAFESPWSVTEHARSQLFTKFPAFGDGGLPDAAVKKKAGVELTRLKDEGAQYQFESEALYEAYISVYGNGVQQDFYLDPGIDVVNGPPDGGPIWCIKADTACCTVLRVGEFRNNLHRAREVADRLANGPIPDDQNLIDDLIASGLSRQQAEDSVAALRSRHNVPLEAVEAAIGRIDDLEATGVPREEATEMILHDVEGYGAMTLDLMLNIEGDDAEALRLLARTFGEDHPVEEIARRCLVLGLAKLRGEHPELFAPRPTFGEVFGE